MSHHQHRFSFLLPLLLLLLPVSALVAETVEVPAAVQPPAVLPEARPEPRLLLEATALEPVAVLPAARVVAAAEIEAMGAFNRAGNTPQKVGFVRPLAQPLEIAIAPASRTFVGAHGGGLLQSSPEEGYTWVSRFEVAESSRLRLRLQAEGLAEGTRMMVYNEAGEAVAFGLELRSPGGELWTPSVAGPVLFFEAHGQQDSRFVIDAVSERFELDADGTPVVSRQGAIDPRVITSCIQTSACVSTGTLAGITNYRAAVAHLDFFRDGDELICSGSLLNDQNPNGFVPYLLTANHCFSNQSAASTLEAFWDYHATTCGGAVPSLGSLPRSNGATLLASSAGTDFTFVRLNSAPNGANGRAYLGWTTTPPADGTTFYGLHHPLGQQQAYSRSSNARTPNVTCSGAPTSNFLYVSPLDGATFGGSSGSPITNSNLQVVGQLFGGCGPNSDEPCLAEENDYDVYGAFSVTKSSIAQWLDDTGGGGGGTGPCVDSATSLCLLNKRFKVEATYRTAGGQTGAAKAVRLTDETGYFWFFNASNIEAVFKLLNACTPSLGNRFWVFAGGLTDVEVVTVVTDTTANTSFTYRNNLGTPFQPITDLTSFATCP